SATARVVVDGEVPIDGVIADLVPPAWAEATGRALAPVRDVTPEVAEGLLPESVRLVELAGPTVGDPVALAAAWQPPPRNTRAGDLAAYSAIRDRARSAGGHAGDGGPIPLAVPPALPRLVIVIDEFASLVGDLPVFVTGLVDVARRGRSLGVHLVLATQRPSGV